MLNPKEYRFMRTEILSSKELLRCDRHGKYELVRSRYSSERFDEQIMKYQEQGYVVEIINMSTNMINETDSTLRLVHTAHLTLYMPI